MDAEQVLAFRLARSGLASRDARSLADAAACPASDFHRDAALHALAARFDGVSRAAYDKAVDAGKVVVAHVHRGAIHAVAPRDHALYGRALIGADEDELGTQLGEQMRRLAASKGFSFQDALAEVAEATSDALGDGRALGKNELHDELRKRVRADLMPWCKGCKSHHVASMLWRYGTVAAGVRLDAQRRYTAGRPGRVPAAPEAVRRFLRYYGPATAGDFADWAGISKPHTKRLWERVEGELAEVAFGRNDAWILRDDAAELGSPPAAAGVRLIPPGDPYLQRPNRPLLAPDAELRKRLFRPVASPGAVLKDGALVGMWRVRAQGKQAEITVEKLRRVARGALADEAQRVADLRGAAGVVLVVE